jgi:hypothetical protein
MQDAYLQGVMLTALPFAVLGLTLHLIIVVSSAWRTHQQVRFTPP